MAKNVFFLSNMRIKHTRVAQLILMKQARPGAQLKWTKMEIMLKLAKIMDSVKKIVQNMLMCQKKGKLVKVQDK